MTTPFDDPQAELAWMFLQNLTEEGDLDEGFALLSDDFTYWNNTNRTNYDVTSLRRIAEHLRTFTRIDIELLNCLNDGPNVVIEAQPHFVTPTGVNFDAPIVYLFETRDGLITSLREYGDPRLMQAAFGDLFS